MVLIFYDNIKKINNPIKTVFKNVKHIFTKFTNKHVIFVVLLRKKKKYFIKPLTDSFDKLYSLRLKLSNCKNIKVWCPSVILKIFEHFFFYSSFFPHLFISSLTVPYFQQNLSVLLYFNNGFNILNSSFWI